MDDRKRPCVFFVYGTLKRGECREHAWPCPPESIATGTTCGRLYDLGEYPAMTPGNDEVVGELWRITADGMSETLRVLDAIEDYRPGNDANLYERRVVECRDDRGQTLLAYTYFYLHPLSDESQIPPQPGETSVEWSAK